MVKQISISWTLALGLSSLLCAAACDKTEAKEGTKDTPATEKKADDAKPDKKEPTTKLKASDLDAAMTELQSIDHMSDSWDKKKARLVAKLGEPQKTEGDFMYWWGVKAADGPQPETCVELKVSEKAGSESGATDAAKCGL
jgi:hypothetical protein